MQEAGGLSLLPTELIIENLASSDKQRNYQQLKPILSVPTVSVSFPDVDNNVNQLTSASDSVAYAALVTQPRALESIFEDLLQRMENANRQLEPELHVLQNMQYELQHLDIAEPA